MSGYGLGGGGLAGFGLQQKADAMGALSKAADIEQRRNMANEQAAATERAGKAQLGSTLGGLAGWQLGAQAGSVGGPMGAVIGGVIGALASRLF